MIGTSFASIVSTFLNLIFALIPVVTTAAVVVFLIGIVQYLIQVSQGKKSGMSEMMLWRLIGLFVIFSLWGILLTIKHIFIPPGY